MSENLPQIDMSGIEALRKLKDERELIHSRLEKMETMRGKVSDAVFAKVRQDYFDRLERVSEEASPLKSEVRSQYRILKGIMDELSAKIESLQLEKEEFQFRNELGEFQPAFFESEFKKFQIQLTEKEAEFHELEETRNLFLSVFESASELEAASAQETQASAVPKQQAPVAEELAASETSESETTAAEREDDPLCVPNLDDEEAPEPLDPNATMAVPFSQFQIATPAEEDDTDDTGDLPLPESLDDDQYDLSEPLPDEALEPEYEPFDPQATALLGDITKPAFVPVPPLPTVPPPPSLPLFSEDEDAGATAMLPISSFKLSPDAPANSGEGTMIISNPKIIAQNQAIENQVFSLGMGTTSLGRSPDNDIHLMEDRISRKHSQIAFGPGGYAIYDLNSENGTYVNGHRIREHFLADGDIIMIGSFKFLYRDH